ncbi:MAG: acetyl-CoA carboxylase carboxyltransferase component [Natronomonas sp.]|jgi:acetyl-CoA carboxylase carboxyltransferase component
MTHREDRDLDVLIERVREAKQTVEDEGRPEAAESQHSHDKLTARERVDYFYDGETFDEIGQLAAPAPTTPETQNWEREDAPADGVVEPETTRALLCRTLDRAETTGNGDWPPKKHSINPI